MTIVSRGVLLFLLDEVGVGIEGSPPLLLLLLVHAGAVGAGSVVEHPAQVGVQGEVGRGGGGALGGVLGLRPAPHHHGAAGGSCRSVLQAAVAVLSLPSAASAADKKPTAKDLVTEGEA